MFKSEYPIKSYGRLKFENNALIMFIPVNISFPLLVILTVKFGRWFAVVLWYDVYNEIETKLTYGTRSNATFIQNLWSGMQIMLVFCVHLKKQMLVFCVYTGNLINA